MVHNSSNIQNTFQRIVQEYNEMLEFCHDFYVKFFTLRFLLLEIFKWLLEIFKLFQYKETNHADDPNIIRTIYFTTCFVLKYGHGGEIHEICGSWLYVCVFEWFKRYFNNWIIKSHVFQIFFYVNIYVNVYVCDVLIWNMKQLRDAN